MGLAHGLTPPVLDQILGSLTEVLPGLTIDLRSGTLAELIEMSQKGGMDLLLIALPEQALDRLETWPLFARRYQMAMWSGHSLASAGLPAVTDLAAEPWIDCADDGGFARRYAGQSCRADWLRRPKPAPDYRAGCCGGPPPGAGGGCVLARGPTGKASS